MVTPRWVRVLCCEGSQEDELTVEFLSTFRYDTCSLTYPGAVSFTLGWSLRAMSVAQFVISMGIYNQEDVAPRDFEGLLRGISWAARPGYVTEADMDSYWGMISVPPHTDRLATKIHNPLIRYIHRILACTLIPRPSCKDKDPSRYAMGLGAKLRSTRRLGGNFEFNRNSSCCVPRS
ncbi:hypothetical protein R6Q57_022722 [Mikania cordata]